MNNDQEFDFPGDRLNHTLIRMMQHVNQMEPGWAKDQAKAIAETQAASCGRVLDFENMTIGYDQRYLEAKTGLKQNQERDRQERKRLFGIF